jgi:hypothetical protein
MINVSEGSVGKDPARQYSLDITVAVQEGETPKSDFPEIREELLEWEQSRGEDCRELTLAYDAEEELWDEIIQFWLRVMETDQVLGTFLLQLGEITLSLVTPDGLNNQELSLSVTEEDGQRDAA